MTELDQIVSGQVWTFQAWAEVFDLYDYPDAPVPGKAMAHSLRSIADLFVRHYCGIFPARVAAGAASGWVNEEPAP